MFATFLSYGTVPTSATYEYLAANDVPNMLAYSGEDTFTNPPKDGLYVLLPSEAGEASLLANYVKANLSSAKIGVLYQND